ncbi:MAG: hypothetical protein KA746_08885 [Pyrinomonadaceae bacterium]|nr:hypothetical protein [Pyrinomonadaceae bacterium]MBP6212435.1 hypothetical protein [Pyrinomonadaceae bacterium]
MKAKVAFGFLFFIGTMVSAAYGQGNLKPTIPFVDKGACPFECCTYREWTVDKPTVVRAAMRDGSSIAFRLKKGERVKGVTGVVVTSRPGEVRVLKRTKIGRFTANKGDTLYLLTYIGEGFHKVWFKGKISEEETYDPAKFREIRQPVSEWWVKIRNSRGQTGWSREPDNFGNKDQCGN